MPALCVRSLRRSDADFILLVEKEAAYMRMAEDRFYQKYPCIVITAKGQPVSLKNDRIEKIRNISHK